MTTEFWDKIGFPMLIFSILCLFALVLYIKYLRQKKKFTIFTPNKSSDIESQKHNALSNKKSKISSGEHECKRVVEKIFNKEFKKIRPDFLKNTITSNDTTIYNLELDCYNDELKLAIEYNGRQHYEYVPFFHKNKEAFYNQKYRDEFKRIKCKENGVILIEVPYTISINDIERYIDGMIKTLNIKK